MTHKLKGTLTLSPAGTPTVNNTLFVDNGDSLLKWRNAAGSASPIATAGTVQKYFTFNRNYPASPNGSAVYSYLTENGTTSPTPVVYNTFTTASITGFSESKIYYYTVDLTNAASHSDFAFFDLYNNTKGKIVGYMIYTYSALYPTHTSGFIRGGADISTGDSLSVRLYGSSTGNHYEKNFKLFESANNPFDVIAAASNPSGITFTKLYLASVMMVGTDSITINGVPYDLATMNYADSNWSRTEDVAFRTGGTGAITGPSYPNQSQLVCLRLAYPIEITTNVTWNAGTPTIVYYGV